MLLMNKGRSWNTYKGHVTQSHLNMEKRNIHVGIRLMIMWIRSLNTKKRIGTMTEIRNRSRSSMELMQMEAIMRKHNEPQVEINRGMRERISGFLQCNGIILSNSQCQL